MVKFGETTEKEENAVQIILDRYESIIRRHGGELVDRAGAMMDLLATHYTNPLELSSLAWAKDSDLMHDMAGINRHLDRKTGKLTDGFLPRYSR